MCSTSFQRFSIEKIYEANRIKPQIKTAYTFPYVDSHTKKGPVQI